MSNELEKAKKKLVADFIENVNKIMAESVPAKINELLNDLVTQTAKKPGPKKTK